jgi:predicted site-specific integrase-resolvase
MKPLTVKQLCNELNICVRTAKYHLAAGKYPSAFKTPTGQWRIPAEEVLNLKNTSNSAVIYARISGAKDRNISDQVERLKQHFKDYQIDRIFQEIASGLNDDRKQLHNMLDFVKQHNIRYVLIENKDRLTRFGYSYLQRLLENNNTKILVSQSDDIKEDYITDLVSIMTSFCARIYGKRSAKNKTLKAIENAHL